MVELTINYMGVGAGIQQSMGSFSCLKQKRCMYVEYMDCQHVLDILHTSMTLSERLRLNPASCFR